MNLWEFIQLIQKNKFKILTNQNTRHQAIADTNKYEPEINTNGNETQQIKEKWVKNLSKRELSDTEKNVLSKGAGFAVVPKQVPYNDYIIATEKACKVLDEGQANALRGEITEILIEAKQPKSNLSKSEARALQELHKDESIVILRTVPYSP